MPYEKISNSDDKDPSLLTDTYLDETVIFVHTSTDEVITQTEDEDITEEVVKP